MISNKTQFCGIRRQRNSGIDRAPHPAVAVTLTTEQVQAPASGTDECVFAQRGQFAVRDDPGTPVKGVGGE